MFYNRNSLIVNDLTNKKIYVYDSKFLFKNNYYNISNDIFYNEYETLHKNKLNQNKD